MTQQTFQMPIKLEEVDPMVLALKAELEGFLAREALLRFEVCVSEALTNLVKHADNNRRVPASDIVLFRGDTSVEVEIFDPVGAQPFDLQAHAVDLSDVDERAESGRGLGLILECADRVTYGPTQARNRLWLEFKNRQDA